MKSKDSWLKKIEYYLKNKIDKLVFKEMKSILIIKPEEKLSLFDGSKILILRNDRIGDLLVSVPFIKTLRNRYPNVEIDILLSVKNYSAKRAIEHLVNNIFVYRKKILNTLLLIYQLRTKKYDIIIDLFDNPTTTNSLIIKLAKPLYSIGLHKRKTNSYSIEVPLLNKLKNHIVDRINQLLMPFGIDPKNAESKLLYELKEQELNAANDLLGLKTKTYRLGINISGSSMSKFWGWDNYKEFIELIIKLHSNYEIIIFESGPNPGEAESLILNSICRIAPPTEDFNIYAAMLSTCDIILSPDTAAVHLAACFQIPCVGLYLFSGTKETGVPWTPYNSPSKCIKTKTNDLKNIVVEDVVNALDELITEHSIY